MEEMEGLVSSSNLWKGIHFSENVKCSECRRLELLMLWRFRIVPTVLFHEMNMRNAGRSKIFILIWSISVGNCLKVQALNIYILCDEY